MEIGETTDVVIVGGGPVGLGLAIELGQRGVDAHVIERTDELHSIPKGQNLTQRTMEHMRAWGVEDEIRAARLMPRDYPSAGINSFGTIVSDLANPWFRRSDVSPYYWADNERLPQYGTEAVLRSRAEQVSTVTYGSKVVGLEQQADHVVVAHEEGTVRASYAVGCDGARSFVRTAAMIGETHRDHDKRMVLLVVRSPELDRLLTERYGPAAFFNALHPDLDGYWRFLGRVDADATFFFHTPVTEQADPLGVLVEAIGSDVEAELQYVGYWDLRIAYADTYRAGRVFIAGDAAHSHPPYGGYGINTGFEDVRNLGWKLAAVLDGWGSDQLLDTYTEERRAVFVSTAEDLIEAFIERDRTFLAEHAGPDVGSAWANRGGMTGVMEFAPHYAGSSIVVGGDGPSSARAVHQHEIRAGHHLGPPPDGRGLFETLGADFTVVGRQEDETTASGLAVALREAGSSVDIALDRRWPGLALVRPDHYVAAVGPPSDPTAVARTVIGASR